MTSVRRSLAITFGSRYAQLALGFVSSIILARLLTPEDFGIYSIAASIVAFGYMFRNFGVGQLIIQAEELSDELLQGAFALTLIVSWTIGILLTLSASYLGRSYENDGITQVMYFMAFNFAILPFGSISDAVLRRNLQFDKIAVITVSSATTSLIIGVISAYLGARYLSIAYAGNAATITTIALNLYFRPEKLPWTPSFKKIDKILSFGLKVGFIDLINRGSDSLTELMIGKAHGLSNLGIYSRAYGSFMLFEYAFTQGIRPIILPYLSEANRRKNNLGKIYIKIAQFTCIIMLPFFTFLYFSSPELIKTLYGDQWLYSIPILKIMCISGMFLAPTIFFDQLLISSGSPGTSLAYQIISQSSRLFALYILINDPLPILAWPLLMAASIKLILASILLNNKFNIKFSLVGKTIYSALIPTTAVLAACYIVDILLSPHSPPSLIALAAKAGASLITWTISVIAIKHPISHEIARIIPKIKL